VPVLAGRYEVDQFDTKHALHLVMADANGRHRGSARLLPTMRPHPLDTMFASLCDDAPPRGATIYEITHLDADIVRRKNQPRLAESRFKERLGRAALLASGGKGNAGIFAEAEQLFLAVESVFEAPELRSIRAGREGAARRRRTA